MGSGFGLGFGTGLGLDNFAIFRLDIILQYQPRLLKVQEVIVHPRYEEASSSGFDIAVYKVGLFSAIIVEPGD